MQEVTLHIGQEIHPPFCSLSLVVGIDTYELRSFAGEILRWVSYTLTSSSPFPFDRWWLVNTPSFGTHFFTATESILPGSSFLKEISGLVKIESDGDASLSSEMGALAMYKGTDGTLYAEEVFHNAAMITFVGHPYRNGKSIGV